MKGRQDSRRRPGGRRAATACALLLALLAALGAGLPAQGGDEPATLTAPGLRLHYAPPNEGVAIAYLEAYPAARDRVERVTGAAFDEPVTVEIVPDAGALARRVRAAVGADLPEWVGGVALERPERILIRADLLGPAAERITGLLVHELTHVAIYRRLAVEGAATMPRWLHEGIAQYAEGRPFVDDVPDLAPRAFFGVLTPLAQLDEAFPVGEGASRLAYAQSESFVRFLARKAGGSSGIAAILDQMALGVPHEVALERVLLLDRDALEDEWISALRGDRGWMLGIASQVAFAVLIVLAVLFGASRIVRRRAAAEARFGEDAEEELEAFDVNEGVPPRVRRLGEGEPPPAI